MTDGFIVQAHARELRCRTEVSLDADAPLAIGSVFKLFALVALASRVADGAVELDERITISDSNRTPGPSGLSLMRDPVDISLHDLALMMMSVSDNAATDAILDRIGLEQVEAILRRLGLIHSKVTTDCRGLLLTLANDLDAGPGELPQVLERFDPDALAQRLAAGATLDAERTTSSTPRELTQLLAALWGETAVPAKEAAWCRQMLRSQIFRPCLAAAFAGEAVVASKSGVLPMLCGEAGVVEFADGSKVALAVFVRADSANFRGPAANQAIARAARELVARLRTSKAD